MKHDSGPPEDPLRWPEDYPPTDPIKKFFIGIPFLGPDLSFFKALGKQQAARTIEHMAAWTIGEERAMALHVGRHISYAIGWKKEFFLPDDHFNAIGYGPRYKGHCDDLGFELAIELIEKDLGLTLPDEFWMQSWQLIFREVVSALIAETSKAGKEPSRT